LIRYADPTAYLITPEAWSAQRAEFCALVGVPAFPAEALAGVDTELHTALGELEQVLAGGQGPVRVDEHGELVIGPLSAEVAGSHHLTDPDRRQVRGCLIQPAAVRRV
jgi:hypothetical protein